MLAFRRGKLPKAQLHEEEVSKVQVSAQMVGDHRDIFRAEDNPRLTESPDQAREDRDRTADDRDQRAHAHDQASEARDARAEAREKASGRFDAGAASDRAEASRDRQGGASDRKQAADDREAASADRGIAAKELATTFTDELTGARRRDAGFVELEREIARAMRTNQPLTLAFIDVDGLKATNDSLGHAAGDRLLRQVVETMRANLRSFDLIVRYGGDEFLCSLPDLSIEDTAKRFRVVNADLAMQNASVTFGLAELQAANDSLEALVARADAALYRAREQKLSPVPHAESKEPAAADQSVIREFMRQIGIPTGKTP